MQRVDVRGVNFKPSILWLIVGIPACTVFGCLLTIYLALSNPDERVFAEPTNDVTETLSD